MASIKYWLWLSALKGLDNRQRLRLLEYFASPENVYYAGEEEILSFCKEEGSKNLSAALAERSMEEAQHIMARCQELGIGILTMADGMYPDRLRTIYDAPILLYYKGRLPVLDEEAVVALVGTRNATPYGIDTAEKLGFGLAKHGAVVISGLARGIDTAAIRGALRAGGITVGVLGGGIDCIYPKENRYLYEDVAATGVLFSEYPPGTEPLGRHFPVRNRIISGLSLATVVVEAPEKSGALITAETALEQGRDVFAVPGNIDAPQSKGCHQLLREGAGLAVSSWDILSGYEHRFPEKLRDLSYHLPKTLGHQQRTEQQEAKSLTAPQALVLPVLDLEENTAGLTDDQMAILRLLDTERPMQADDIIEQTQIPARRAMSALTVLEIESYVCQLPGKCFVRTVAIG